LLGGDELGRTQRGNNNGYCQDNAVSWYDWENVDTELLEFCRKLIAMRRAHPVLRRRRWFHGRSIRGVPDVAWIKPDGTEMTDEDWEAGFARSLGMFLNGEAIPSPDERGQRVVDDSFLVLFSAHHEPLQWHLPEQWGGTWHLLMCTADRFHDEPQPPTLKGPWNVPERSVSVFIRKHG